ncbi:MAG: DUF86 domain-containing protein [Acidimicrobiia bacterium]|nr:DUF86 domain-containing protein [Acidimicrobiia bacterium]
MVDQDILLAKIASIRKCLDRIRNVTGGVPESLDHQDTQDIFVLNLQRAVQAAIDLAAHLVADLKLGLPETLKENFALLETSQIVDAALSARLQAMAGFRNIAVHNYQQLNVAILKSILAHRISDLEHFVQAVSERYRRT